ncbi:subunit 11 of integrator complex [Hamiltosporidium tvaerminnensis]|uniref:Subunit 11 of integrator complex n=4 Tax=Hamiltosporidium TaxID=1176354 RepID=A0A4Q9L9U6_9MICR|nr:hypothetical protein LUQ84_000272 [Hamiltosporidium tvaerminnensis]TBU04226.1 subunit 11 of integrator complex [Hamiltosporidium tvaerminnensis]TBU20229.1 subunit 11 of integrator complex [Hamiltosporidium tvaerminnensis]
MQIIPLGAGQDVGRSCIIVYIEDKTIMFDCGMHMGYSDARRFPDFSYLSSTNSFDKAIDCLIISHFHLDHCGALPYFTEVLGYNGPIFMTHPTKAICPILLEDYRKITAKINDNKHFTSSDIKNCMNKVIPLNMNETYVHDGIEIVPYYAGHVLGAAMFYVKVKDESVVYTGDYNTTPDRHLGAAWIDCLKPDVLITESTYACVIRECRKAKEREFINCIDETIKRGGKVLVPIFALGRAQELCLLVDAYWEKMGYSTPVYFSAGLTEKANQIYRLFINYTNENIREKIFQRNMFDFKHIKPFQKHFLEKNVPMVIFASPGMLHSGLSLSIFKEWCNDEKNLIIIPGYCVKGTVGEKILNGCKEIKINNEIYEVKIEVKNLGFSAHADEKGILQIINQCKPRNVVLVHGEKSKMKRIQKTLQNLGITAYKPANGIRLNIERSDNLKLRINKNLLQSFVHLNKSEENVNLKLKISMEKEVSKKILKVTECEKYIFDNRKEQ